MKGSRGAGFVSLPSSAGGGGIFRRITYLLAFVMAAAFSTSSRATDIFGGGQQSIPQLRLTAHAERSRYGMSEELELKTVLLNAGGQDVYVYRSGLDGCWNAVGALSIDLIASDGSTAEGDILLDCVPPPPKNGDVSEFLKLGVGGSHEMRDTFKIKDLVSEPGEYDVVVSFRSSLSRQFIREFYSQKPISKLTVWTSEEPAIVAPRFHLTVAP